MLIFKNVYIWLQWYHKLVFIVYYYICSIFVCVVNGICPLGMSNQMTASDTEDDTFSELFVTRGYTSVFTYVCARYTVTTRTWRYYVTEEIPFSLVSRKVLVEIVADVTCASVRHAVGGEQGGLRPLGSQM